MIFFCNALLQLITNFHVGPDGSVTQNSSMAHTLEDGSQEMTVLPESETKLSLLGNFLLSEGMKQSNETFSLV